MGYGPKILSKPKFLLKHHDLEKFRSILNETIHANPKIGGEPIRIYFLKKYNILWWVHAKFSLFPH